MSDDRENATEIKKVARPETFSIRAKQPHDTLSTGPPL
jgi:hypothetical protein